MRHVARCTAEAMRLPVRLRQLRPAPLVHHLPRRGARPEGCGAPILLTFSALVVPVRVNVVVVPVVGTSRGALPKPCAFPSGCGSSGQLRSSSLPRLRPLRRTTSFGAAPGRKAAVPLSFSPSLRLLSRCGST
eukprot:TRINITY_DN1273_c0_g1_i5.p2 TRINITY_DN1273_c0_g1~~TRINITY_DN1273_c0_g1_i5.p2  ORF type:complete len:133 (-),score=14.27 TRINITY_DN1273_c0_g1_i5:2-400(-)